jgi:hypothetical protein
MSINLGMVNRFFANHCAFATAQWLAKKSSKMVTIVDYRGGKYERSWDFW